MWERLFAAWSTPNALRTRVDDLWVWCSITAGAIVVFAAIVGFEVWRERCQERRQRLGIRNASEVNDDQRDGSD